MSQSRAVGLNHGSSLSAMLPHYLATRHDELFIAQRDGLRIQILSHTSESALNTSWDHLDDVCVKEQDACHRHSRHVEASLRSSGRTGLCSCSAHAPSCRCRSRAAWTPGSVLRGGRTLRCTWELAVMGAAAADRRRRAMAAAAAVANTASALPLVLRSRVMQPRSHGPRPTSQRALPQAPRPALMARPPPTRPPPLPWHVVAAAQTCDHG